MPESNGKRKIYAVADRPEGLLGTKRVTHRVSANLSSVLILHRVATSSKGSGGILRASARGRPQMHSPAVKPSVATATRSCGPSSKQVATAATAVLCASALTCRRACLAVRGRPKTARPARGVQSSMTSDE